MSLSRAGWAVFWVFVAWFVFTSPAAAGHAVHQLGGLIGHAFAQVAAAIRNA